jgi:hypothetical protein
MFPSYAGPPRPTNFLDGFGEPSYMANSLATSVMIMVAGGPW